MATLESLGTAKARVGGQRSDHQHRVAGRRARGVGAQTVARMSSVEFDPGQTGCLMPDPIPYLEKVKAYRAGKARGL